MTEISQSALDKILSAMTIKDGSASAHIDDSWLQGRTTYGGMSAALALAGAKALHPTDAPLRYAQISFIGPVSGDCTVNSRVLRQSKSSLFLEAGVSSEMGFGTAATFAFSPDRNSHLDYNQFRMPDVPAPEDLEPVPPHKLRPAFAEHFDMRPIGGPRFPSRGSDPTWITWVRFVEQPSCDTTTALLALGDALPPAAMALFTEFGPISSMNWTVNMLSAQPQTEDGWWLLENRCRYARNGMSVQDMIIYNSAGLAVASGSQAVAVYV